jgi:hypothetical protein
METGKIEKEDLLLIDDPRIKTAHFVIGNLPEISVLKEMAKNKTTISVTIGNEKWNLSILDNDDSKTKEITFIQDVDMKQKPRFGISVSQDFSLAFGSIAGLNEFPFIQPFKLTELIEKFGEVNTEMVKKSLSENKSVSETAIALKLRPEYVSKIASQPIPPKD